MRAIKEFIVEIKDPFKDHIETEGGLKLFKDRRWSPKETANIVVTVLEEPLDNPTEIKKGMQIAIDPTVLFRQVYAKQGEAESANKIKEDFYRIHKSQIVMYKENNNWVCYNNNVLTEQIEEHIHYSSLLVAPTKKISKDKVKVAIVNKDTEVNTGDVVFVNDMGVDFYLEGKHYLWYRNQDILAKYE